MNSEERAVMHSHLYSYVEKFTAARWGTSFVEDLIEVSQLSSKYSSIQKFTGEIITQFNSKKVTMQKILGLLINLILNQIDIGNR